MGGGINKSKSDRRKGWNGPKRRVPVVLVPTSMKDAGQPCSGNGLHQQNPVHLDSLDRAGQKSIEPQSPQKGAMLYSFPQTLAGSVEVCQALCRIT